MHFNSALFFYICTICVRRIQIQITVFKCAELMLFNVCFAIQLRQIIIYELISYIFMWLREYRKRQDTLKYLIVLYNYCKQIALRRRYKRHGEGNCESSSDACPSGLVNRDRHHARDVFFMLASSPTPNCPQTSVAEYVRIDVPPSPISSWIQPTKPMASRRRSPRPISPMYNLIPHTPFKGPDLRIEVGN